MPSSEYNYVRKTFTFNGKRYETRGTTLEEAITNMVLMKQKLERGEIGISSKMTVARWAATWCDVYKKETNGSKSYEGIQNKIERFINPSIGSLKLTDVTDIHLQKIINSRAGYSKSHVSKLMQIIRGMFRQARISRLIVYDPSEGLVMPNVTEGSHRSITDKERKEILKLCATQHKASLWVQTMLFCGLRPAETYALDWRHIDFERARLKVEVAKEAGTNIIKEPKSKAGIREIPIMPELLKDLQKVKRGPFEPVFTQQKSDKRHTKTSGDCLWASFIRALDIQMGAKVYRNKIVISVVAPDLTPYCLRHTYATDLQGAGIPINIAKTLMGHSDIKTTSKIYTHTVDAHIDNASILQQEYQARIRMKG